MPSTMNLLLQLVILGGLLYGVIMVKKGRINSHSMVIFSAFVLNTLSILFVMVPSAIRIIGGAAQSTFTLIVVIHIILGFLVEGLGAYLFFNERFDENSGKFMGPFSYFGNNCLLLSLMNRLFITLNKHPMNCLIG